MHLWDAVLLPALGVSWLQWECSCKTPWSRGYARGHTEPPRLPLPRGYLYAGLEFGAECYCGHKVQASNASESECNMECKGERSNTCGGVNRLSIYRLELAQESARRCKSAASMRLPAWPRNGGTPCGASGGKARRSCAA